jgi:hypothetical protein
VLTRAQTTGYGAPASRPVVDELDRFRAVAHRNAEPDDLAVDGVQYCVPGASRRVARTPLGRAAEVAVHDEAVVLDRFLDLDAFALDEKAVLAATHPRPGHAEMCEFTHGYARFLGEDACHLLVGAPVGAAHGVQEMQRRAVALGLDAVPQ